MTSFDVVSLFTSIPIPTARTITDKLLSENTSWIGATTSLDKEDSLDLLDLCLSTEFSFQGSYYKQITGTPMGSPLSSFLAEAVLQNLEKKIPSWFTIECLSPQYGWVVGPTLVLISKWGRETVG